MKPSRCFAAALLICSGVIALAIWWSSPVEHGAMYDEHVRMKRPPLFYGSELVRVENLKIEGLTKP